MGRGFEVGNKVSVLAQHFDAPNVAQAERWSLATYGEGWRTARCTGVLVRQHLNKWIVDCGEGFSECMFKTSDLKMVERARKNPQSSSGQSQRLKKGKKAGPPSSDEDSDSNLDGARKGENADSDSDSEAAGGGREGGSDKDDEDCVQEAARTKKTARKKRGRPRKSAQQKKTDATTSEELRLAPSSDEEEDTAALSDPDVEDGDSAEAHGVIWKKGGRLVDPRSSSGIANFPAKILWDAPEDASKPERHFFTFFPEGQLPEISTLMTQERSRTSSSARSLHGRCSGRTMLQLRPKWHVIRRVPSARLRSRRYVGTISSRLTARSHRKGDADIATDCRR